MSREKWDREPRRYNASGDMTALLVFLAYAPPDEIPRCIRKPPPLTPD